MCTFDWCQLYLAHCSNSSIRLKYNVKGQLICKGCPSSNFTYQIWELKLSYIIFNVIFHNMMAKKYIYLHLMFFFHHVVKKDIKIQKQTFEPPTLVCKSGLGTLFSDYLTFSTFLKVI